MKIAVASGKRGTGLQIDRTLRYLKDRNLAVLHTCHCTALAAKVAPLRETGVGLQLEYDDRNRIPTYSRSPGCCPNRCL
ncbi:hypothetical protein [Methanosphaerula palustris]|uniref:Uncharacterized protein n=1 Tax=Methanosphaerula palustris (strain ATCC BAA-1556 / DSM 19958 / E1-9c) TaxID=521011 RepID=B8GDH4_METPE|nr:hypothetical protein [Methanosphaerula palustris]ACL17325.1 hypothetical protein Mpal_2025 [Methanosphaerula palustris E1-9c]